MSSHSEAVFRITFELSHRCLFSVQGHPLRHQGTLVTHLSLRRVPSFFPEVSFRASIIRLASFEAGAFLILLEGVSGRFSGISWDWLLASVVLKWSFWLTCPWVSVVQGCHQDCKQTCGWADNSCVGGWAVEQLNTPSAASISDTLKCKNIRTWNR